MHAVAVALRLERDDPVSSTRLAEAELQSWTTCCFSTQTLHSQGILEIPPDYMGMPMYAPHNEQPAASGLSQVLLRDPKDFSSHTHGRVAIGAQHTQPNGHPEDFSFHTYGRVAIGAQRTQPNGHPDVGAAKAAPLGSLKHTFTRPPPPHVAPSFSSTGLPPFMTMTGLLG
eukprot:365925-Chlamydomonas_euryale.AAC.12